MKRLTNVAASVRQRLLDEARRRGESFDYVASLYARERFLDRLTRSPHRGRLTLKGATVLALWSDAHRPTRDLDSSAVARSTSSRQPASFARSSMCLPRTGCRSTARASWPSRSGNPTSTTASAFTSRRRSTRHASGSDRHRRRRRGHPARARGDAPDDSRRLQRAESEGLSGRNDRRGETARDGEARNRKQQDEGLLRRLDASIDARLRWRAPRESREPHVPATKDSDPRGCLRAERRLLRRPSETDAVACVPPQDQRPSAGGLPPCRRASSGVPGPGDGIGAKRRDHTTRVAIGCMEEAPLSCVQATF